MSSSLFWLDILKEEEDSDSDSAPAPSPAPSLKNPFEGGRTLHQIWCLSYEDFYLRGYNKPKVSKKEREIRELLTHISKQHREWNFHAENAYMKSDSGQYMKSDSGQLMSLYLYDSSYPPRNIWQDYLKEYREKWWRRAFDDEYTPMCGHDCTGRGFSCFCGEFNGMVLCERKGSMWIEAKENLEGPGPGIWEGSFRKAQYEKEMEKIEKKRKKEKEKELQMQKEKQILL